MLRRVLGGGIALEFRLAPALPPAAADQPMLEEVLLGLVWNARDAMPDGGRLVVAAVLVTIAEDATVNYPGGRSGRFASLSVADTCGGIPPEIRPRLFEPFFTTKAAGRGAGLGLAAIFGIVRQHPGWLSVASVVGRGSTFTVFLPIAR